MKEFLEAALEGEMTSHMRSCLEDSDTQNRRNGKSSKKVQSPMGAFEFDTPRDREGRFTPQLVKTRQTVLNESLDNQTKLHESISVVSQSGAKVINLFVVLDGLRQSLQETND